MREKFIILSVVVAAACAQEEPLWLTENDGGVSDVGLSVKLDAGDNIRLDAGTTTSTLKAQLGVNLGYATDWVGHWPFVDAFKLARPWIPQQISPLVWDCRSDQCEASSELNLTSDGWIASLKDNQAAATIMFVDHNGHFPGGKYIVLYDGEGYLDFGLDARVTSREPGRMLLQVTPGHTGVWMQLSATNIANPLRNIRIIMPGFEKSYEEEPFHPLFIDSLSKFKTIRFMNWQILPQRHNDDAVVEWDDLPSPHLFQSKNNGVHPEWMIKLANKLKADPWFNLPHKVSNDFITQFAMFVKEYLDPDLKAYVEYSNEVWNSLYPQYGYARDEGLRLQLSQESRQASLRYYSQKSVEIFKIWKNVLGPDRVVGVLASQSTQPALGLEVMSWKEAYLSADVYATAPYISGAGGSSTIEVLDNLEKDIERMMLNERQNALNAHSFGLKHVAYEGGQHLTSPDQQEQSIFLEVNQHPEIKDIYLKYLNQWFEVGDGPFVHFSYVSAPSQYGSWGALEYQDQRREEAPKYDALLTFIESR